MSGYQWDFSVLLDYRELLLGGILTTLRILAISLTSGIVLGALLALARTANKAALRLPAQAIIETVRAVPPLVLVVWAYYCLPILVGWKLSGYWTCALSLGLYTSVFFAEIFRAGLQGVDPGHIEAGLSNGMTPLQVLCRVTAPIAFLRILPAFVGQCVMAIKNSVLGSYIAVGELLYEGQRLSTATFRPLETLTFVALFFVLTILPLSMLAGRVERRVHARYFRR